MLTRAVRDRLARMRAEADKRADDTAFNTVVVETIPAEGYMTDAELRYHNGSGWGR